MSLPTQPYKGTRDFYPEDKRIQKYMFKVLRGVVESFGYQEYDAPILEPLEIYTAKSGEEIVNQQLYSFEDKGGRQVAIRPEMTPSVSRMVAGRRQELAYPLRWFSIPNLWRYERPQAGRLREHWQLNVDLFGVSNVSADHELIMVADSILKAFGAPADSYEIRISSRQLVEKFLRSYMKLNDDQVYQTSKLIDRWHKIDREEFNQQAKDIFDNEQLCGELLKFMESKDLESLPVEVRDDESVGQLRELLSALEASDVKNAQFDFSIIRGMDYYGGIIFEVFDTDPENTRSMFGGGRYDGLVGLFGVESVPVVGFGMGDVTLQRFLEAHNLLPEQASETKLAVILVGDVYERVQPILAKLRLSGINIAVDASGRKLDAQLKHADKSGVKQVLLVGEKELEKGRFKLKNLDSGEEKELPLDQIIETLKLK